MTFNDRLAESESGGRYGVVNSLGYSGKYQFGEDRLDDFRRATGQNFTIHDFTASPLLQEAVQSWHVADIDAEIQRRGFDRLIGSNVGGVTITLDGLRAMAHLGGKGGMAKFIESGGAYNPADANGTSLADYGAKFSGGNALATPQTQQPQNALSTQTVPQQQRPELMKLGGQLQDVEPFLRQSRNKLQTVGFL